MTTISGGRVASRMPAFPKVRAEVLYVAFGAATFLLHVLCADAYGYQRDELYFLVCGAHLAWGYVDQPPLIALVAAISTALFGTSLHAIRFLPAVAAALTVVSTGLLARRFGAGRSGQTLAMLAVIAAPFYLYVGTILTMNAFEPLLWTAAAWLFVRILDGEEPRAALWFGLAGTIALGILNKYTMAFFALAAFAALIALPQRRVLRGVVPWAAIAALIAAVAPNLWWQHAHGWPQIELLTRAAHVKNPELSPLAFVAQQIAMVNPATFPLWAAGLRFFWTAGGGRYRLFPIAYALLLCACIALHGKVYYMASIYPLLFAGGAGPIERFLPRLRLRAAYAGLLAVTAIAIAPQVLPILPLPTFIAYQRLMDFRPVREENHPAGRIPQQFADMLGWEGFAQTVAHAYGDLPAADRAHTAILTRNYGLAGAIDVLGPAYRLPHAISGHNNYYLWGPGAYDGSSVLAAGLPPQLLRQEFRSVRRVAVFHDPWLMPDENDIAIYRCTLPVRPLADFWPRLKAYV